MSYLPEVFAAAQQRLWRSHTSLKAKVLRDLHLPKREWSEQPHTLPGQLIVNLTSYPGRFSDLPSTIECLLKQSIKPDRVILWIHEPDKRHLPASIEFLARARNPHGFEVRTCPDDLRSYKKIVPALREFPDAFHVTADDDLYYGRNWLHYLVKNWDGDPHTIVCRRAHGVRLNDEGRPLPYTYWAWDVDGPVQDQNLFPTTGPGVLYPPGSLAPETEDQSRFLALAPKADDVWLYWMAVRAGSAFLKTPEPMYLTNWPLSQETSLFSHNVSAGGNDEAINNMIEAFGWPESVRNWPGQDRSFHDLTRHIPWLEVQPPAA